MKNSSVKWLKRLFSSRRKALSLPPAVFELLQSAPVQVQKIAGQGRGLVATRDLEYGETLFSEQPYLCIPASSKRKQVCYHCLKVLPQGQADAGQAAVHIRSGMFCSHTCLAAAHASYYALESQVNLTQLERYCQAHGERFPLMAARLALMVAQRALHQPDSSTATAAEAAPAGSMCRTETGSLTSTSIGSPLNSSSYVSNTSSRAAARQAAVIGRLSASSSLSQNGCASQEDPSAPLSFLCFANVPPPPPGPWVESHHLLLAALSEACDCREDQQEGQDLAAAAAALDIDWYVAVLARLHLNTFKVDAVLPMDWSNPYAAAAAMVQPDSSSGSALYLLASLFNHSCESCVNINFPNNDGTAVFTAARHISAGEQLYISYTDAEQEVDVRQEYLAFAYGFRCSCQRCQDDIAELRKTMPPQIQN